MVTQVMQRGVVNFATLLQLNYTLVIPGKLFHKELVLGIGSNALTQL